MLRFHERSLGLGGSLSGVLYSENGQKDCTFVANQLADTLPQYKADTILGDINSQVGREPVFERYVDPRSL